MIQRVLNFNVQLNYKNLRFIFILLLVCIVNIGANGQQKKLDSLHKLYIKCKHEDEHKLVITNQLAFVYTSMQLDSAFILADEAISLSKKLKNQKELLTAYNTKAIAFQDDNQHQACINLCNKVINLSTKSSDKNNLGDAYLIGGGSYFNFGNPDSAKYFYNTALGIFKETHNEIKIGLVLITLSSINFYSDNKDKALFDMRQAISIFGKTIQSDNLALAYICMGGTYTLLSMYDSAQYYLQQAIVLGKKSNHVYYLLHAYSSLGLLYGNQANYPKAIQSYLFCLRYCEIYKSKSLTSYCLNNLAWLYREMGDYSKALNYLNKQKEISTVQQDPFEKAGLFQEYSLIFIAQHKYELALAEARKMLQFSQLLQRKDRITESYGILAQSFEGLSKLDSAMIYYQRAVVLARQIEYQYYIADNLTGLARTLSKVKSTDLYGELLNISSFEARMKNALIFAEEAYQLSQASGDARLQREAAKLLSELYEQQQNIGKAYTFHKLFTSLNDSIMSHEKTNAVANLQFQFETEKKDNEINLLKTQKELEKLNASRTLGISFGLGGALLGIIFVAIVFYMQNKKTKSINLQLETAYSDLKNTQQQLVQSEKLAAFGVMASRVAHEIQNPLNFVNNFSEISQEMLDDFLQSENEVEKKETAGMLTSNLQKINEHGKRADAIVKKLLEHTRAGTAHEFFENE
ncbi:MAG: tetratricopeptide repeat protein [Bacteroidetes bacterium]|nr:tetratricopeptide repeat protein [Bacteroidota bacterium]